MSRLQALRLLCSGDLRPFSRVSMTTGSDGHGDGDDNDDDNDGDENVDEDDDDTLVASRFP